MSGSLPTRPSSTSFGTSAGPASGAGSEPASGAGSERGSEPGSGEGGAPRVRGRWRVRLFDEIDSTNAWLAAGARAGSLVPGDGAVARFQSVGRGRLDRRWEAPIDSALMMSVLVRPAGELEPLARWHRLGAVVGLALLDVCRSLGAPMWSGRQHAGVALKWPNDVIVVDPATAAVGAAGAAASGPDSGASRKLAGILLEAVPPIGVVIGMGLNRVRPHAGGAPGGIWLDELVARPIPLEDLTDLVLDALASRLDQAEGDWERVHSDYRATCCTIGREVRVALPGDITLQGVAVGVDADGHLQVADRLGGMHDLAVGDVVHVRAM